MKNSLAVAMGRVSTAEQRQHGQSLTDQDITFRNYANKLGHQIVHAFSFNESASVSPTGIIPNSLSCLSKFIPAATLSDAGGTRHRSNRAGSEGIKTQKPAQASILAGFGTPATGLYSVLAVLGKET